MPSFIIQKTSRVSPRRTGNDRPLPNRTHRITRRRSSGFPVNSLSESLSDAQALLPAFENAKRVADMKQEPALRAERSWRAELETERTIREAVNSSLVHLEESCQRVLALPSARFDGSEVEGLPRQEEDMIMHHMDWRLQEFLSHNKNVQLWKAFKGSVKMNAYNALERGHLGTQVAACCIDEVPWLICCVCVATDPLVDVQRTPKGLLLHWSVTDDESSSWHNSIPRGWSTYPGVCEPHGSTAWQTTLAHYNPEVGGQGLTQIPVHSVVIQIPMDGIFLEKRGGIKFILKRNDTSDEVWIKSVHHGDFYVSLAPAIHYLNPALDPAFDHAASTPNTRKRKAVTVGADRDEDNEAENQEDSQEDCQEESDEESSSKFIWARALAEDLIIARERQLAEEEDSSPYVPSFAWLEQVTAWLAITDYAINAGSSLSQYARELRCLLEMTGDPELAALRDDCAKLESDIEALDAIEIQQRSLQLEKDRLWEERELAIKEAARVHHELDSRVETARRAIVRASGRETEVSQRDLVDLCSSMVLGSEIKGSDHGAGFFRRLFAGSESPLKHILASESIDRVGGLGGLQASVVTQVYFEGEASAVDAVMNTDQDVSESEYPDGPGERGEVDATPSPKFPFDTVLVAIAFGEDFPSKISNSDLKLHWGFVTGKNGGWMPPTPGTVVAIHRATHDQVAQDKVAHDGGAAQPWAMDSIQFEAYHMRHRSGKTVLVDPLVRGIVLRVPVADLKSKRITGIEFVIASRDQARGGQEIWIKKECGSNLFAQIPLIRE